MRRSFLLPSHTCHSWQRPPVHIRPRQGERLEEMASGKQVYDEWGNEMGLAGAVSDGMKLVVR
mgnify:CR=1 FL=1